MLVVATEDFEIYHDVVGALQDRGMQFTTVDPDERIPDDARAVITGPTDDLAIPPQVATIVARADEARAAVSEAVAELSGEQGRRIVGVDPGDRPGIAVLDGDQIVAAFQLPEREAITRIERELEGGKDPLVRVGDGARLIGARIVEELDEVRVEVVDETGTTPYLGPGARGMGDVLAAVNIARRDGDRTDSVTVEPTDGELQRIKDRARDRSPENRAITERLARAVAAGELTLQEAMRQHADERH